MTRKSKQPGGHNPLTYHERKRLKYSGYGTQSTRLTTGSQLTFGHCCLNLSPIVDGDAVATPSGHIYSREAIVQYLLSKTEELKKQKVDYERRRLDVENRRAEWEEKEKKNRQDMFVRKDQGAMTTALVVRKGDNDANEPGPTAGGSSTVAAGKTDRESKVNSLKHVSYWLASSQPQYMKGSTSTIDFNYKKEIEALPPSPPRRPPSPMSGEGLKLKQLIPLHLVREGAEDAKSQNKDGGRGTGKVLCAVSHKAITTQPTIAIKNTGQVMLKSVYKELAKPSMTCPVTGKRFQEKDVLELIKGKSGFAASGEVTAKKYNPTLT